MKLSNKDNVICSKAQKSYKMDPVVRLFCCIITILINFPIVSSNLPVYTLHSSLNDSVQFDSILIVPWDKYSLQMELTIK